MPDSPGVAAGRQRVAREKPTSKKELASLRERFQNTLHLCAHLYRDLSGVQHCFVSTEGVAGLTHLNLSHCCELFIN